MFYIGSLEAASQEAFYGKARDVSKLINCCLTGKFSLRRWNAIASNKFFYSTFFFNFVFLIFMLFVSCETLMSAVLAYPLALMSLLLGLLF